MKTNTYETYRHVKNDLDSVYQILADRTLDSRDKIRRLNYINYKRDINELHSLMFQNSSKPVSLSFWTKKYIH